MITRPRLARCLATLCTAATIAGVTASTGSPVAAAPAQRTVHITNPAQFVVPENVTSILVHAIGGYGQDGVGAGTPNGGKGAAGGTVDTRIPVTGGETLDIVVGRSGDNGAYIDAASQRFAGGSSTNTLVDGRGAGAGGSASVVLRAGQPLVVAGGGGGGASGGTNGAVVGAGGSGGAGLGHPGLNAAHNGGASGGGIGGQGTTSTSRGEDGHASIDPSSIFTTFGGSGGAGGGGWNGGVAGNIGGLGFGGGGGAGGTSYSVASDATFGEAGPAGEAKDGSLDLTFDGPYLTTTGEITTVKNPSLYGEDVAFTVTMVWGRLESIGVPAPTGTVTFGTWEFATGTETTVGTRPLAADGTSTFNLLTTLPLGWTNVWASYSGDDNHSPFKTNYYQQQVVPGASSFAISPVTTDFGTQDIGSVTFRDVTVTNTGAAPWQPVRGGSSDPAFAILATTCTGPLAPSASCVVTARFTPTAPGPVSGSITLTDGSGNAATLPLTGSGATIESISFSPASFDFGNQVVGSLTDTTVTVTNTGNAPWMFNSVSTDQAPFSQPAYTCTAPVAPGETCTITFRFHPVAEGSLTGQLTVRSATGRTTVFTATGTGVVPKPTAATEPMLLDFGIVAPGAVVTKTVTVRNTGQVVYPFRGVGLRSGSVFAVPGGTCFSAPAVPVGQACTLDVRLTAPTAPGRLDAALSIVDSTGGVMTLPMTATVGRTAISLSPSTIAFGRRQVGSTSTKVLTVTNTGELPWTLAATNPTTTSIGSSSGTCTKPIAPGATCTMTVTFTPRQVGPVTGSLQLVDSTGKTYVVTVTGTGTRHH